MPYADLLPALEKFDLEKAADQMQRARPPARGVDFKGDQGPEDFPLDVVPRMLSAAGWEELERAFGSGPALNEFIRDAYSEQRIVRDGVDPRAVIETSENLEPEMVGVEVRGPHAPVIGFDIVRGDDGRLRILEDNALRPPRDRLRLAARTAIDAFVPLQPPAERRDIAFAVELLAGDPRRARPTGRAAHAADLEGRRTAPGSSTSRWPSGSASRSSIPTDLEVQRGGSTGPPTGEEPSSST